MLKSIPPRIQYFYPPGSEMIRGSDEHSVGQSIYHGSQIRYID
jgi:hypothetical protein